MILDTVGELNMQRNISINAGKEGEVNLEHDLI
jgi:hypothetical protein